jgi:glycosyltransferase involved in cell wall biosynthesis
MDVHRVGSRYTFSVAAPRYFRSNLRSLAFDAIVEDLNKVPLFTPLWSRDRLVLLVHHLFGVTAFEEATMPVALATWLLEKPLASVYRGVPIEAVSESTAEDLVRRGFDRASMRIIPNGVDLEFYRPDAHDQQFERPTFLYLGRLKKYKRVDIPIRALAELTRRGVDARLIIAGRGDAEPALRTLAKELGVEGNIEMPGFVTEEEKRRLFRRTWVHVLTSPKEGWGITNLEAGACGTPTVASDSPGLRDSVRNGETGFLVPHGDVGALADRLQLLFENAPLRDKLGLQARAFAERFTWDRAADATEQHLLALDRRNS